MRRWRGLCYFSEPVKFLIFIGTNVGGYIGWALCEQYGIMTAFFASGLGSVAGVYVGWKVARAYL